MQNQKLTTVNETINKENDKKKGKLKLLKKIQTKRKSHKMRHVATRRIPARGTSRQHVRSERMLNEFLINQRETETETEIRTRQRNKTEKA